MKRKVIWTLVACTTIVTLIGIWFVNNFEQVPTKRWVSAQPEARRNPFLALERLLAEQGRPISRIHSPAGLDNLPADAALILDSNRRRIFNFARVDHLLDWVKKGGYLIVAAETSGEDPLLSRLGISRPPAVPYACQADMAPEKEAVEEETAEDDTTENDAAENDAAEEEAAEDNGVRRSIAFSLPGNAVSFHVAQSGIRLAGCRPAPVWRAGPAEQQSLLLHYAWGEGQITVVNSLARFDNTQLGMEDHAELIWALLQTYRPQGNLHLASQVDIPTLWEVLAESAWMVLISLAVTIGLWMWRIIPRFGGLRPTRRADRRDLVQHLAAIGHSVWHEGGMNHWLAVVRQGIRQRLSLRHPYIARMPNPQQHDALARIAACRAKAITTALTPGQVRTADEFTEAMRTLQRLDQQL